MTTRAHTLIADAVAAVIAAAIAEYPDAPPDAQARQALRALQRDGWYVGPIPPTATTHQERTR